MPIFAISSKKVQLLRQASSGVTGSILTKLAYDVQHLSYGVCLEVRGEIIRTVLCCIAHDSCAQS